MSVKMRLGANEVAPMRVTWKRKTKEYKARREIRIIRLNIQFGVWVLVAVIYDKHNP